MFYIYILSSTVADKFYIGHSDNPQRRLEEHNNPIRPTFTSKYKPWELELSFEVNENRGDAMVVEKYIKNQKSKSFIKKIIDSKEDSDFMKELVRVPFERD